MPLSRNKCAASLRRTFRFVFFCSSLAIITSCVSTTVPLEDYTLAKTAFEAAVAADAARYVPQLFYKAEKSYKKGEQLYKERDYSGAKEQFLLSRKFAERAETESRKRQFKSEEEGSDE